MEIYLPGNAKSVFEFASDTFIFSLFSPFGSVGGCVMCDESNVGRVCGFFQNFNVIFNNDNILYLNIGRFKCTDFQRITSIR